MVAQSLEYGLLAIDLDGTLLNSQHELPPQNRAALHRAHEAGLRIVLCTGRSYPETRPILEQIGLDLDATVTVFGALISDARSGRTLERVSMSLDLAFEVTDWFGARDFAVMWLNDAEQAGLDGYVIDGRQRHPAVDRWVERTPCRISCVDKLPENVHAPMRISIIDEPDVLTGVSEEMRRDFDGRAAHNLLRAPLYNLTIIETFAPDVSKWHGIRRLCQRWDIDPARTLAIGDDINDLDMVRSAGLGVAMDNAHPEVKKAAQRVIADNDSDAIATLIHEVLD